MITIGQSISPIDSYTKLLISGRNPANIKDIATRKTVGNIGTVAFQSVYNKLNPNALLFGTTSKYLRLDDNDDWNYGTSNFTIDYWAMCPTVPPLNSSYIAYMATSQGTSTANYNFTGICGTPIQHWIYLQDQQGGIPVLNNPPFGGVLSNYAWYHIAFVRNGNYFNVYLNGILLNTTDVTTYTAGNFTGYLFIGVTYRYSTFTEPFKGYLDEVRISKGIARWTTDFTPPKRKDFWT